MIQSVFLLNHPYTRRLPKKGGNIREARRESFAEDNTENQIWPSPSYLNTLTFRMTPMS